MFKAVPAMMSDLGEHALLMMMHLSYKCVNFTSRIWSILLAAWLSISVSPQHYSALGLRVNCLHVMAVSVTWWLVDCS